MEQRLNQTYMYTDGHSWVAGFTEDRVTYLRVRGLLQAASYLNDLDDRAAWDSLCAGVSEYVRLSGGAYCVLCQDGVESQRSRRIYASKTALADYLKTIDPDGREHALLLRALDLFDRLKQDSRDPMWEPREAFYPVQEPADRSGAEFGTGTYPDSDSEPDPDVTADLRPLGAILAAAGCLAAAMAVNKRRRRNI